jgi:hypothetical protein
MNLRPPNITFLGLFPDRIQAEIAIEALVPEQTVGPRLPAAFKISRGNHAHLSHLFHGAPPTMLVRDG